jgi:hypothetical protein
MNIENNRIYWKQDEVLAAEARGESLLYLQQISNAQGKVKLQNPTGPNRHERRKQAARERKTKRQKRRAL